MYKVENLLRKFNLYHKKEEIINRLQTSIRLEKFEEVEEEIPIGSSKLGGLPDLPKNVSFPRYSKGNLTFLAQINLTELKMLDKHRILPDRGILFFFYDMANQPWGFGKDEEGGFKVLFYEGDLQRLLRTPYPEQNEDYFPLKSFKANFKLGFTIPEKSVNLSEQEIDSFCKFREAIINLEITDNSGEPLHYMLGTPFNIQNDVFEEISYYGNEEKYEWSSPEIKQLSKELILLFQFDTDDDLDVMFGDSGMLYFCIYQDDLRAKQFANTKLILQCY